MENQNSVAYVGKIGSVVEIPGADNIELVLVGGWQAITKKGEYKEVTWLLLQPLMLLYHKNFLMI